MDLPSDRPVPEFLRSRLRLFLSADIVGSTALKQERFAKGYAGPLAEGNEWFSVIQGFYIESGLALGSAWAAEVGNPKGLPAYFGEQPRPWKTVGDEVLFVKILTDYRQVAVALKCWVKAIERLRRFLKARDSKLDVKSTAWVAGFPVANKEVVIDLDSSHSWDGVEDYFLESGNLLNRYYAKDSSLSLSVDFIGPSIDTGFRLSTLANTRKFIVSVDVAYILAKTMASRDRIIQKIPIFYDGRVNLKGVLGADGYPVFWIDIGASSDTIVEDKLRRESSRDDVVEFCEEFYSRSSAYMFAPFIDSPDEQGIKTKPEWYDELHGNMVKNFYDSLESKKNIIDAIASPDEEEAALPPESIENMMDALLKKPDAPS